MIAISRCPVAARVCTGISLLLVVTSVATHSVAYRLPSADPGTDVIAALA